MSKKIKILAIIPARGNSKRLTQKNIRPLNRRPLIAYTIDAAKNCPLISKVIVSTEDAKIAAIATDLGVRVQARPDFLSCDDVGNDQVIAYTLKKLAESAEYYEVLVLLQPTSPLRTAIDLTQCLEGYLQGDYNSAMSVCLTEHHPAKAVTIDSSNVLLPYVDVISMEQRSQLLPQVYRQNGAIYVVKTDLFLKTQRLYQPPCFAYVMDGERSVDIDTSLDLKLADLLVKEGIENDCCSKI